MSCFFGYKQTGVQVSITGICVLWLRYVKTVPQSNK